MKEKTDWSTFFFVEGKLIAETYSFYTLVDAEIKKKDSVFAEFGNVACGYFSPGMFVSLRLMSKLIGKPSFMLIVIFSGQPISLST